MQPFFSKPFRLGLAALSVSLMAAPIAMSAPPYLLYAGGYGKGIYAFRQSASNGAFTSLGLVGELRDPSFVISDASGKYLYAVSELGGGGDAGGKVASFQIDRVSGKLKPVSQQLTGGSGPCHLALDHTGKLLATANYGDGSVSVFRVDTEGHISPRTQLLTTTGSSVDKKRQDKPHAHEVVFTHDNGWMLVPDLGLDQIRLFHLDAAARQVSQGDPAFVSVDPGSGPRHIALSRDEKFVFVQSELKSVVTAFRFDSQQGSFEKLQALSTVPDDAHGENSPAEIALHPNGKFLYASNRGHDSIAVFSIDGQSGKLTRSQIIPTGGAEPRAFALTPDGGKLYVANQKSNSVKAFSVGDDGKLSPTSETLDVPAPTTIQFVAVR